jgi:hypothetical protein
MLSLTFLESLWRGKGLKYPKWFKNRSTFEYDPLNSVVEFSTALRFENTQNLLL